MVLSLRFKLPMVVEVGYWWLNANLVVCVSPNFTFNLFNFCPLCNLSALIFKFTAYGWGLLLLTYLSICLWFLTLSESQIREVWLTNKFRMFWNVPEHCLKRISLIEDEDDILSNPRQIHVYILLSSTFRQPFCTFSAFLGPNNFISSWNSCDMPWLEPS